MDSTALLSVVGGVFLLSLILVASLCTYCWGHKQPTSIHQRPSDSEYHPASSFGLRHPVSTYAPHTDHARIGPYPHPNSPNTIIPKVRSCPPSETGSQASYVNQNGEEGITCHVNHHESEDEPCDPPPSEYIVVLPDLPMPHSQSQAPSRASSLSSGDQYINVKDEKDDNVPEVIFDYVMHTDESDSDIPDYENFQNSSGHRKESYSLSRGSQSSDERDSSDYVNTDPNLQ